MMKRLDFIKRSSIIIFTVIVVGCTTNYNSEKQQAIVSERVVDTLFLGLKFGMERKDFFAHCWELNKKGIIMQGPGNMSVEYALNSELKAPAYLRFYPEFVDNKISKLPAEFSYRDWAPWNKALSADSLILDVNRLVEVWYGKMKYVESKTEKQRAYYRFDGNRQIILYKKDTSTVRMEISDMRLESKSKK